MNNVKLAAILTTALTLVYVLLLGNSAIAMFSSGHPVGIAMGILLVVFPILGIIFIALEVRFGIRIEKLATRLEREGDWPKFNFELRPSGRVIRESADAEFKKYQQALEVDRANWRRWFALGLVYDAAGDRARARAAMREALKLSE
jgi:tetratricopeptide (TPR) repeat protein